MKLIAKIKSVEVDFGTSIEDILIDFANEYSYSFTIKTLGFHHSQLSEFKHLFQPRKMGYSPRPHIRERNLSTAPKHFGYTVRELCEKTGLSKSTIRQRIKLGWPIEKVLSTKKYSGNYSNFGKNRDNKKWKNKINNECQNAKDFK
jgi:hypothetical protein